MKINFRKNFFKLICLFLCFLFISFSLLLSACKSTNVLDYTCFNTSLHIESYSKKITKSSQDKIISLLNEIENSISTTNETSFVSKFNNLHKDESIVLDDISSYLFQKATGENGYYSLSNSKFNIFVYPLLELWNLSSSKFNSVITKTIPSNTDIESVKNLCNLENAFSFNSQTNTLTKMIDGAKIDLGGIAKGYASERVVDILNDNNICDGYINFGSSSMYIYSVNSLSIRHPRKDNDIILKLDATNLKNVYISTSGDYERFFVINGKRYCHIIDKNMGAPIDNGIMSATIIGNDGTLLDALSTSLMMFSYDINNHENCELTVFVKNLLASQNIQLFITYKNGNDNLILTNCEEDTFTLLDSEYRVKKF